MGGILVLVGFLGIIVGLMNVVHPIRRMNITSRKTAALILGAGFTMFVLGRAILPSPPERANEIATSGATPKPSSLTLEKKPAPSIPNAEPAPSIPQQLATKLTNDLNNLLGDTITVPGVSDPISRKLTVKVDKPSSEREKQLGKSDYWPEGKGIYEVSVSYQAPSSSEEDQSGAQQVTAVIHRAFASAPDLALVSVTVDYLGLNKDGLLEHKGVGYTISRAQLPSLDAHYAPGAAIAQLEFLSGQSRWWEITPPRLRRVSDGDRPCENLDSGPVLSLLPKISPQYRQTWCGYVSYSGLHFQLAQTAIHRHYPIIRFALAANKWALDAVDKANLAVTSYPDGNHPDVKAPQPYLISFELSSGVPAREDLYDLMAQITQDLFQASEWITAVQVKVVTQVQPPEKYRINPDVSSTEVFMFHRSQLAEIQSIRGLSALRSLSDASKSRFNKDRL